MVPAGSAPAALHSQFSAALGAQRPTRNSSRLEARARSGSRNKRNARGRIGDEQFEIFAPGEREALGVFAARRRTARAAVARPARASMTAPHPLAAASRCEVGREAVANNPSSRRRCGSPPRNRPSATRGCGRRNAAAPRAAAPSRRHATAREFEAGACGAEWAGNGEHVARASARARLHVRRAHFADGGDRDRPEPGAREVAADDRRSVLARAQRAMPR